MSPPIQDFVSYFSAAFRRPSRQGEAEILPGSSAKKLKRPGVWLRSDHSAPFHTIPWRDFQIGGAANFGQSVAGAVAAFETLKYYQTGGPLDGRPSST